MTSLPITTLDLLLAQQGNNPPNWPKLVVLLIVVGFSFFSWLFKQLQKQAEKRRIEQQRQRMETEDLRTGRVEGRQARAQRPSEFSPREESSDATSRREATLRDLRQRREQAMRGQGQRQTSTRVPPTAPSGPRRGGSGPGKTIDINLGGTVLRIPGSTGPTVPGTRPSTRTVNRGPTPRAQAQPQRRGQPLSPEQAADLRRRQAQKKAFEGRRAAETAQRAAEEQRRIQAQYTAQQRAAKARREMASEEGVSGEDPIRRLVPSDPDAPVRPSKPVLSRAALRASDLRRAILIREILGPPVSMR